MLQMSLGKPCPLRQPYLFWGILGGFFRSPNNARLPVGAGGCSCDFVNSLLNNSNSSFESPNSNTETKELR